MLWNVWVLDADQTAYQKRLLQKSGQTIHHDNAYDAYNGQFKSPFKTTCPYKYNDTLALMSGSLYTSKQGHISVPCLLNEQDNTPLLATYDLQTFC